MNDREEIAARVENFRRFQQRLCAERNARMDKVAQQIRDTLSEIHAQGESGRKKYYWPTPTL